MSPLVQVLPGQSLSRLAGVQRRLQPADPAAGAEWTLTLPGGAWWRLLIGRVPFVASAAAGNRFPGVEIRDDATVLYRVQMDAAVVANANVGVNLSTQGGPDRNLAGPTEHTLAVPDVILPGGWIIASSTGGLLAGDNYGQAQLLFEEIDLGPYGEPLGVHDLSEFATTGEEG